MKVKHVVIGCAALLVFLWWCGPIETTPNGYTGASVGNIETVWNAVLNPYNT
jgi:hypothetical protein